MADWQDLTKNNPKEALRAWFRLHSKELHQESHDHIEKLLEEAADETLDRIWAEIASSQASHSAPKREQRERARISASSRFRGRRKNCYCHNCRSRFRGKLLWLQSQQATTAIPHPRGSAD